VNRFRIDSPWVLLPVFILLLLLTITLSQNSLYPKPVPTPTPTIAISATAQAQQANNQLQAAVETWQQVLRDDPENAEAYYRLGLLFTLLNPENAPAYFDQAAALDSAFRERAAKFTNTLRLAAFAEEPAHRLIQIGQALASEQEWTLAREAFRQSALANPYFAEAWAYFGEAQEQLGEDGRQALETAIQLNPQSFAANIFLGNYWQHHNQPEVALVYLQAAAQIEPDNPFLEADIGAALAAMGNYMDALEHYQRLLELAPNDINAWMMVAEFSLEYDVQVESVGVPAARQAVIMDEYNPKALTLLARAYSLQGDDLLAARFFQQALEANPNYAPTHYYLGFHYLTQGDAGAARPHLEKAVELAENGEIGKLAQALLDQYFP
jgi:tetratricopeptide (TPR) repeat protein